MISICNVYTITCWKMEMTESVGTNSAAEEKIYIFVKFFSFALLENSKQFRV